MSSCHAVCVCLYPPCTAESSRVCGGNQCCSTVVDAARNGGSGRQAHSSYVGGWVTFKLLCMLDPNHTAASPLTLWAPPSTGQPPRFVVEACSEGPSHERMPTCVSTAHLHQPRLQPTLPRRMAIKDFGALPPHHRTRGRMSARVRIPPHLHSTRFPAYHLLQCGGNQKGFLRPPQPRRDLAPCSRVTRDSPPNPAHHARPLVSAHPHAAFTPRSSTAVLASLPAS
jgi:hypothetical protein